MKLLQLNDTCTWFILYPGLEKNDYLYGFARSQSSQAFFNFMQDWPTTAATSHTVCSIVQHVVFGIVGSSACRDATKTFLSMTIHTCGVCWDFTFTHCVPFTWWVSNEVDKKVLNAVLYWYWYCFFKQYPGLILTKLAVQCAELSPKRPIGWLHSILLHSHYGYRMKKKKRESY